MIMTKSMAMGMSTWMLGLRVSKLDQKKTVQVARMAHTTVQIEPSDIWGLNICVTTNLTEQGVLCGINFFQ